MQTIIRWTEDELEREIRGLDARVQAAGRPTGRRSKCAQSYLKQLLKDRKDTLRLLRYRMSESGAAPRVGRGAGTPLHAMTGVNNNAAARW